jgi:hypothetical protein
MEPAERRTRETDTPGRPDPDVNVRRLLNAGRDARRAQVERSLLICEAAVEHLRRLAAAVERGEADPEVLAERIEVLRRTQDAGVALVRAEPGDADYVEVYRAARRQNEDAVRILTRPALRPRYVTPPRCRGRVTIAPGRPRRARPRQRRSRRGPRATRAGPDEDPAEPAEPAAPIDHAARRHGPFPPPRQERGRRG